MNNWNYIIVSPLHATYAQMTRISRSSTTWCVPPHCVMPLHLSLKGVQCNGSTPVFYFYCFVAVCGNSSFAVSARIHNDFFLCTEHRFVTVSLVPKPLEVRQERALAEHRVYNCVAAVENVRKPTRRCRTSYFFHRKIQQFRQILSVNFTLES